MQLQDKLLMPRNTCTLPNQIWSIKSVYPPYETNRISSGHLKKYRINTGLFSEKYRANIGKS